MPVSEEKTPPKRSIKRTLIIFIGNVIGLELISIIGLGVSMADLDDTILLVLFIGIVNSVLWPLLTRIFMPFFVFTFGIGSLVLNGLLLQFLGPFFNINISGPAIILAPLSMALITTILSALATLDDDSSYYRPVYNESKKKRKNTVKDYPGLIVVEIDGLAYDILKEAMDKDLMPTVKSMVENTHTLRKWETDFSSQTGASQAGILHGNNEDITAFRWIEKENNNKMMQCSGVSEVKIIEERISDGNGLLADDGASRSNLFSGDTDNVIFTASKILNIKRFYNRAWFSVFTNPSNFARISVLIIYEMILEIISQVKHKILNIQPRINRGVMYIPTRAITNVFLREINTSTLIGDMMIGDIDVAYSTYLGYDEIAHHSGIRDEDSFFALKHMDGQIKHLINSLEFTPRDYKFVIQSDHGQSPGATFKQRYGESFEDFVKSLLPKNMKMFAEMDSKEDHYLEELTPSSLKTVQKSVQKTVQKTDDEQDDEIEDSEVVVLASGNLAMIYLTQWSHRLTSEEMNKYFPELLPGILENELIGFIVVKSSEKGDLVIGTNGIYYLDTGEIEGENPLEGYGKNIAKHIKRNCSFKHTPDILVNSFYNSTTGEVCAFEELIGSHGGAGGTQTEPFILYPKEWDVPEDEILGAESIYRILKENLNRLKEGS